jgi:small redox-active disulfide protein 2
MNIKVLGSGCANCVRLEKRVVEVLDEMNLQADVEHVTDYKSIMSYGIMSTPGLVINGQVKSSGRIPSKDEIEAWVKAAQ